MSHIFRRLALLGVLVLAATAADGQWLTLKTPGIPRTADGKPNLKAPVTRIAGRPDLSGLWRLDADPYVSSVIVDLKAEEIDPSVAPLAAQRMEDLAKDDPAVFRCLPNGPRAIFAPGGWVRLVQTPAMIVMLYEDLSYRQIFMDGRSLPKDPSPSYMGYSVGRWDGDTLVVDSIGFNDTSWLDYKGHPHSEALKVTERITRTAFGRLNLEIRFEDSTFYKRAWTIPARGEFVADTEMLEYVCNENQKDAGHLVGKASDERKNAVTVPREVLAKYVGRYTYIDPSDPANKSTVGVTLVGDTLFMDQGGKDKAEMIPLSEKTFSMMAVRIDFEADYLIFHIVEGDLKATKDK